MNTFSNAVINQDAYTTNGMLARKSTAKAVTDLFFKIGASRGKNIIPQFVSALVEDQELAIRVALWARDVTSGAGERELFRSILRYLESNNPSLLDRVLPRIAELGRFDDYFVFETKEFQEKGFKYVYDAIHAGNALAAKWTPREKSINKFLKKKGISKELSYKEKLALLSPKQRMKYLVATNFRKFLGMSAQQYRCMLAKGTSVVESKMCKNHWDEINFSHVPSLASARYKKAFNRHTPKYGEYVKALVTKSDPTVKVNAAAVYPYDVIKGVDRGHSYDKTEKDFIIEQWNALPNYVGDSNILPMVDVSGSMTCGVGNNRGLSCLDVAVSLGLYLAEKNQGKFKDTFLTFSGNSQLVHLKGNVLEKMSQMNRSKWEMNTNLHKAFERILDVAVKGKVPQEEMPEMVLILSDMQFDGGSYSGVQCDEKAIDMIKRKYQEAGYQVPKVVFWNLHAYDNVPVEFNQYGVALVSGFSPSILKAVLSANFDDFTPYGIMLKTIMSSRYDF